MSRFPERIAAAAAALAVVAAAVDVMVAQRTGLLVPRALLPFHFWTVALAVLAALRCRLGRLAGEERRDNAMARAERADSALFKEGAASDLLWAGRTRDQFERWAVPAAAPALAVALGLWCWQLARALPTALTLPSQHLLAAAFLGGQAFLLFLLGRYLVGLARETGHRALRGPGLAAGATSAASAVAMLGAAASAFTVQAVDRYVATALLAFLGLVAVELAARFILAIYSPRRGEAFGAATESRIASVFADPASWTRSLAQAVDYQFGFNVSESWFFRFFERALLPLLAIQLCVLYLMSSLVFIGPEEEGILEHFGKPVQGRWQLSAGFHAKLPWPFETVQRFPSRRVLSVPVGFIPETNEAARVIVWTVPHYRNEDMFLTASRAGKDTDGGSVPVSLVSLNVPVEYRVTNLYAYAYRYSDPAGTLQDAAYRALTRELARRDLMELLTEDRLALGAGLRDAIQADAERLGLGVEITLVGLQGIHPPMPVADAFESVVGAIEEREARIMDARAYTNRVLPLAAAHAQKAIREAEAYRSRREVVAAAEAEQFERRLTAFRQSPEVFKSRMYLSSLQDALSSTRKYIVDAPASQEVIYLNLEEQPFAELFDIAPAPLDEVMP
jgi:membrane protease subunit HflK